MKRHHMDALRVAGGDFTSHERKLRKALRELIKASDGLTSAIECATDQFDPEKGRLMDATSAAEKVLKGGAA
jgi:hypothetical protein